MRFMCSYVPIIKIIVFSYQDSVFMYKQSVDRLDLVHPILIEKIKHLIPELKFNFYKINFPNDYISIT